MCVMVWKLSRVQVDLDSIKSGHLGLDRVLFLICFGHLGDWFPLCQVLVRWTSCNFWMISLMELRWHHFQIPNMLWLDIPLPLPSDPFHFHTRWIISNNPFHFPNQQPISLPQKVTRCQQPLSLPHKITQSLQFPKISSFHFQRVYELG